MQSQEETNPKGKPSNSLGDQRLPKMNKEETDEMIGSSNTLRGSQKKNTQQQPQQKQQQQQPPPKDNLQMEADSIYLEGNRITFISEKDFKYEKICWVCKIQFGKINERQHHCRLCAHSVCGVCSNKRVNDNRACDLCFLKLKNVKGEIRKKKLLAAMKNFMKDLKLAIDKSKEEVKKLGVKRESEEKAMKRQQIERETELENLKARLALAESTQKKMKDKIEKQEECVTKKQSEKRKEGEILNGIESQLKSLQNEMVLKQQGLESKQNQLKEMFRQKQELQESESFLRLPNYERAKRNDAENICEAIIFLDNNDLNNKIDHYNTLSNHNLFHGSTSDSSALFPSNQEPNVKESVASSNQYNSTIRNKNDTNNDDENIKKTEYASSYNQGIIQDDTAGEVIMHTARSSKKPKRAGKDTGCLCN